MKQIFIYHNFLCGINFCCRLADRDFENYYRLQEIVVITLTMFTRFAHTYPLFMIIFNRWYYEKWNVYAYLLWLSQKKKSIYIYISCSVQLCTNQHKYFLDAHWNQFSCRFFLHKDARLYFRLPSQLKCANDFHDF